MRRIKLYMLLYLSCVCAVKEDSVSWPVVCQSYQEQSSLPACVLQQACGIAAQFFSKIKY